MTKRTPWNKDKSIGPKEGFTPMQIKELRRNFREKGMIQDLALFSFVLDTMLRCSDALKTKIGDVVDHKGNVRETINLKQKKTSRGLKVLLSLQTRQAIENLIKKEGKFENHYLFTTRISGKDKPMSSQHYRNMVKSWAKMIGINPIDYSTHSLRRTIPTIIYQHEKGERGSMESLLDIKEMLGHSSIESTLRYLNIKQEEALDTRKRWLL